MNGKHEPLTEAEMVGFRLNPALLEQLRACAPRPARILDWGCGRGRAVALLRQEGFEAYGIDTDLAVLRNGHALLRGRGFEPERLLRHLDDIRTFADDSFDIVFSEETLEHVADIAALAHESFRLLRPGGLAVHSFPGVRRLVEPHLRMPLVHWLGPGAPRRLLIQACLLLGHGPRPPWPEAHDECGRPLPLAGRAALYARYLEEKVHYRRIAEIASIHDRVGFRVRHRIVGPVPAWAGLLPKSWPGDGFPAGNVLLLLSKPDIIAPHASTGSNPS
ncbi:MAG: class I SAM-dependent methyltransferase [Rhodocyclaceae bacterium]|nr:class I SAM-dependent methyltransferase [Rhodocyclaceae bacterium]